MLFQATRFMIIFFYSSDRKLTHWVCFPVVLEVAVIFLFGSKGFVSSGDTSQQ